MSSENSRSVEEVTLVMAIGGEDSDIEQIQKMSSLDECPENIDNEGLGSSNNDKKADRMKEEEPFVVVDSCDRQTSDTGGEEEAFSMLTDVNNAPSPVNVEEGLPGNRKDEDVISLNEQDFGQEQHECMEEGFTLVNKGDTDEGVENKTEEIYVKDLDAEKQDESAVDTGNTRVVTEEDRGVETVLNTESISEENIHEPDTEENDQNEIYGRVLESEPHSKSTEITATSTDEEVPSQMGLEMEGCDKEIISMTIDETGKLLNGSTRVSKLKADTQPNHSTKEHSHESDQNIDGDMLMNGGKTTEGNSGVDKTVSDSKTDTIKRESERSNTENDMLYSTSKQGQPDQKVLSGDKMDSLENGETTAKNTDTEISESYSQVASKATEISQTCEDNHQKSELENKTESRPSSEQDSRASDAIVSSETEVATIPVPREEEVVTLREAGIMFEQLCSDINANDTPTGDLDSGIQGQTLETCDEKNNIIDTYEVKRESARPKLKATTTDVDASEVNFKDWDYFEEREKAMMKFVYFWKRCDVFTQWHMSNFHVDGLKFNCAEQYMMYKKAELFQDETMMKTILTCKDPRTINQFGRKVKHFEEDLWRASCLYYVKEGNKAKFSQNRKLKDELVATHPMVLVEANPLDSIWGIGLDNEHPSAFQEDTWKGLNLLGYILTEVRDEIMAEDGLIPEGNKKVYLENLKADYCVSGCSEQATDRHAEPVSKEERGP